MDVSNQGAMIVGLTGQTGAGKSTISRMFSDHGLEVIDADVIARDTMENSKMVLMDLVLEFSTQVIHPDATLNREKLAEICFSDKKKLRRLNEITYPHIIEAILHKIKQAREQGAKIIVLDAPTLYESGLDKKCDYVVAVTADEETRVRRIIGRDEMTEEAARRRVNAQQKDDFYSSRADEVILNNEDLDSLRFSFMSLYGKLQQMAADGSYRTRLRGPAPKAVVQATPPDEETPQEGLEIPPEPVQEIPQPAVEGDLEELASRED